MEKEDVKYGYFTLKAVLFLVLKSKHFQIFFLFSKF